MRDSQALNLLLKLADALHRYDTPSHRLEETVGRVAEKLQVEARFFVTPTSVFASVVENGETRTALLRTTPGDINLGQTAAVDAVVAGLLRDRLTPEEAGAKLDAILAEPRRYPAWLNTLAFVVVTACAARFFGGGLREVLGTAAVGLMLSLLADLLARRKPSGQLLFPSLAAFTASMAACALNEYVHDVSIYVVTVAGLIVLIPGLTFTVAMNELATRNLVSGTARFAAAMSTFVGIGFGVALGLRLGSMMWGEPAFTDPIPLPQWTQLAALLIAPFAICILFQSVPRDFGWALAAGAIAFYGARGGALVLGPELGTFLAALALGVFSNVYARVFDRAASTVIVPGFLLLVPGSIGFSSVFSLIIHDFTTGLEGAYAMALVAAALVSGLLLANTLIPARRSL